MNQRSFRERFSTNNGALAGLTILSLVVLAALAAPLLFPGDPLDIVGRPLTEPFEDWRFPLGTDRLGRDMLAGLVHGARASLFVGLVAAGGAILIGILVGAVAGYFGGWIDEALMRLTETFQTVPGFILALALVAVMGPGVVSVAIAIALVSWTGPARITRAEFLSLKQREFVSASRVLGQGHGHIIFREILPNALAPIIVLGSVIVAAAILIESALSYLGLSDPNRATWGQMIAGGRAVFRSAWYVSAIPGFAILLTVLAVSLVGEGLTDAANPRTGRR
ncbi:MAG: ABC transporter permease [Alphaproteobacteria bacterium]|nr:ABC transporter permease [Alphaproteobacteria bacterium]